MSSETIPLFAPSKEISDNASVSCMKRYHNLYKLSLGDPAFFWGNLAKEFHWETEADPANFFSYNFDITKGPIFTKWLEGASTNICYNLLDRNVKNGLANKIAFHWYVHIFYLFLIDHQCDVQWHRNFPSMPMHFSLFALSVGQLSAFLTYIHTFVRHGTGDYCLCAGRYFLHSDIARLHICCSIIDF